MLAPEPEVIVAAADKRRAAHHGAAAVRDVALGHLDRVQVSSKPFRYVNYHQTFFESFFLLIYLKLYFEDLLKNLEVTNTSTLQLHSKIIRMEKFTL